MTPEERQKAFLDGLNALGQQYGFQIGAQVQTEQLGPVVQCRPVVIVQLVEGWKEPEADGKPILTDEAQAL